MLSFWQSGRYRLMDEDVPTPAPSHCGRRTHTIQDEDGEVRSERSGPQSLARSPPARPVTGGLRSNHCTNQERNTQELKGKSAQTPQDSLHLDHIHALGRHKPKLPLPKLGIGNDPRKIHPRRLPE